MSDLNWGAALLWGFVATVVLTALMSSGQGMRLTRMSIPYMLGAIFTPDRDRAKLVGMLAHFLNGLLFALVYVLAFESWGRATWALGAATGFVQAMFVLTAGMWLLPAIHPRMTSEERGPTPTRLLEPPGFLALNYGRHTPFVVLIAHLAYGAVLGAFYPV